MFFSPTEMMRLTIKTGMMVTEAQMVIGLRLMGMGSLWSPAQNPASGMTCDKLAVPDDPTEPKRTARKKSNVTALTAKSRSRKA